MKLIWLWFPFGLLQTQVEVAVAAADGDLNVAVEILMTQQVCIIYYIEQHHVWFYIFTL